MWFALDDARWPIVEDQRLNPDAQIALPARDDWVPAHDRLEQPLLYCGFYFGARRPRWPSIDAEAQT